MSKHVGDGNPGWPWKPYKIGSYRKTYYHIETKSGETYYQCWPNAGYFHPLLDDRHPKEGIHESEVAYVLELAAPTPSPQQPKPLEEK